MPLRINNVIPAKAGIHKLEFSSSINSWIPAFAGMTGVLLVVYQLLTLCPLSA